MTRASRKKARNRKRSYAVILTLILLAAVGVELYKLPPSLLDVGRFFRHAANKFSQPSADSSSAEAVLRGTVFDRNLHELAVSYHLYSLYVRPSEISDRQAVVSALSGVTGLEEAEIELRLRSGGNLIKIAENLEQQEVDAVTGLHLAGVFSKPVEERFYPEHEVAADLLGYTGGGIGLKGIEGGCDTILQPGDFKTLSIAEIDFQGAQVLGNSKLDIVLTLDLEIQKAVEQKLRDFVKKNGATRGLALAMNAKTGALLAWASRPSFNPNYFWQGSGTKYCSLFQEQIDTQLYNDFLSRGAAVSQIDDLGGHLPPSTIAAENYGLQENEIRQFQSMVGLADSMECKLPDGAVNGMNTEGSLLGEKAGSVVSPLQFITAAAGMLNGGWKVKPHILDAVYDASRGTRYARSKDFDSVVRRRIMSPAKGIMMRMRMGEDVRPAKDLFLHTSSVAKIVRQGDLSRYVMQDMMVGAIPAKSPEVILLMITGKDELDPMPAGIKQSNSALADFGAKMLPVLYILADQKMQKEYPLGHDPSNYNQFLISRRIDFQEKNLAHEKNKPVMPLVTGLSLRKALQRLNSYKLEVQVEGSGRIVTQQPESGQPLNGVGMCTLVLESNI